jgi:hypothetical protein
MGMVRAEHRGNDTMIRLFALAGIALGVACAALYLDSQPRYAAPGAILGVVARTPVLGLIEYHHELARLAEQARGQQAEIDACLIR